MKMVVSRKGSTTIMGAPNPMDMFTYSFGNTYRVMEDNQVEEYVKLQVNRGFVCAVFNYEGSFHAQTQVVKAA